MQRSAARNMLQMSSLVMISLAAAFSRGKEETLLSTYFFIPISGNLSSFFNESNTKGGTLGSAQARRSLP